MLVLEGVGKIFGSRRAVQGVSLVGGKPERTAWVVRWRNWSFRIPKIHVAAYDQSSDRAKRGTLIMFSC